MNYYNILKNTSGEQIFKYIMIFILFVIISRRLNINTNMFIPIIVLYFYFKINSEKMESEKGFTHSQLDNKISHIKPSVAKIKEHGEIIDFLFSIQDYHKFNPQAYEEMVDDIIIFIEIYNTTKLNNEFCEDYFYLMVDKKRNAMNALHSIIFKLPTDEHVVKKLMKAIRILEDMLNNYCEEILQICKNNILDNGYNTNRKPLYIGPSPYNSFLDSIHSYDYF